MDAASKQHEILSRLASVEVVEHGTVSKSSRLAVAAAMTALVSLASLAPQTSHADTSMVMGYAKQMVHEAASEDSQQSVTSQILDTAKTVAFIAGSPLPAQLIAGGSMVAKAGHRLFSDQDLNQVGTSKPPPADKTARDHAVEWLLTGAAVAMTGGTYGAIAIVHQSYTTATDMIAQSEKAEKALHDNARAKMEARVLVHREQRLLAARLERASKPPLEQQYDQLLCLETAIKAHDSGEPLPEWLDRRIEGEMLAMGAGLQAEPWMDGYEAYLQDSQQADAVIAQLHESTESPSASFNKRFDSFVGSAGYVAATTDMPVPKRGPSMN